MAALAGGALAWAAAAQAAEASSAPGDIPASPQVRQAFRPLDGGVVVHIQSGMACYLGGDSLQLASVQVFGASALGEAVGCDYSLPGGTLTLMAMRSPGLAAPDLTAVTIARIVAAHPEAQPTEPPAVPGARSMDSPSTASLLIDSGGRPAVTSVWIAVERDWVVQVRASYAAEARDRPELIAAFLSLAARQSIIKAAASP